MIKSLSFANWKSAIEFMFLSANVYQPTPVWMVTVFTIKVTELEHTPSEHGNDFGFESTVFRKLMSKE